MLSNNGSWSIRYPQTCFAWLRALPEAPSEKNLLSLIERLSFVRSFALDPQGRGRIHPDRWAQLVRDGADAVLAGQRQKGRLSCAFLPQIWCAVLWRATGE